VVVRDHDGGCARGNGRSEHLPRVNQQGVQSPLRQHLHPDHAPPGVEEDHLEVNSDKQAAWRLTGDGSQPAQTGVTPGGGTGREPRMNEWNVELVVVNSHDAGCAYQLHAGIYRRICSNGLVISSESFHAIRFRHSGCLTGEVVQASLRLVEAMPKIGERIARFRERILEPQESLTLAEQALLLRYPPWTSRRFPRRRCCKRTDPKTKAPTSG